MFKLPGLPDWYWYCEAASKIYAQDIVDTETIVVVRKAAVLEYYYS